MTRPVTFLAVLMAAACSSDPGPSAGSSASWPIDASPIVCTDCGACEQSLAITSANHVEGTIDYPDPPPAGGDHSACWATWGVHADAVAPEHWVHNLEHGGVVFLYNCSSGCSDADNAVLADISFLVSRRVQTLMTPDPTLPGKLAVVSWGHRLVSDCMDIDAAAAFYAFHVDDAPESSAANPPSGCP